MNPSKELEQHPEGKQDQDVTMRVCGCGSVCGVGGVRVMGCEWVVRVLSGWMCLWMGGCVFGVGAYVWLCVSGCVSECVSVCVCACWQGRQEHSWESEEIHWKQRKKGRDDHTKWRKSDKDNIIWHHFYVESENRIQMNLLQNRNRLPDTENKPSNEVLLYSTGNLWWNMMEDNVRKRMCVCVSHFAVQQRLREQCKSTKINSLKFKKKEWLNKRWDSVKKRKTNMFTKGEVGEG